MKLAEATRHVEWILAAPHDDIREVYDRAGERYDECLGVLKGDDQLLYTFCEEHP